MATSVAPESTVSCRCPGPVPGTPARPPWSVGVGAPPCSTQPAPSGCTSGVCAVSSVPSTPVKLSCTSAAEYVKPATSVPTCASGLVTTTSTTPAACAAVVAVIVVALTTATPVAAAPPSATVAPVTKFVPVIVTAVPPPGAPVAGAIPVTVGAGGPGGTPRFLP